MHKEVSSSTNCRQHKWCIGTPQHSHSDTVARQVGAIATNEKIPTSIAFGDRYGNTTILDFDTDPDNDQEDDISDDEYSDHDE